LFSTDFVPAGLEKAANNERRKLMSSNENRVLIRKGARPLTQNEMEEVTGARTPSVLSVIRTNSPSGSDFTTDE
jgi:hypothetical protein